MKTICGLFLCLIFAGATQAVHSQSKKSASSLPRIEVQNYKINATLTPDAHELTVTATISFSALEPLDIVVFDLNENLNVQKVLNVDGVELEFSQDETGPGRLTVRFPKVFPAKTDVTIKIEYTGGFDRDQYSRTYTRDENSAYIGMEGSYLLYYSKWFPIYQFMAHPTTAEVNVTVPLGITVIGPGAQQPVITKGITETFGWTAKTKILPNSIIAGQYFQNKVNAGNFTIDCFAREDKLDAIGKSAEAAAGILEYFQKTYGPSAAGNNYRLVEVDDRLSMHYGMLGTIFITHRELSQANPPIRELARRIACQWWQDTIGIISAGDLWLVDGMAYYSAAQYIGNKEGAAAMKEETNRLTVLALKFENKSPVRMGLELGYRSDKYESVVAGKGSWILKMLEGVLGESKFKQLIQQYIHDCTGKGGSTHTFQKMAEKLYGKELDWFFAEWIDSIGVPALQADYSIYKTQNGFRVSGVVKQDRDLFRMPVEIAIISKDKEDAKIVDMIGKSASFDITSFAEPTKVVLDPYGKLLRDSKELQTSVQLSLGDDLKEKEDFVGAIQAYDNAIKLNAHCSIAHFRVAEVFYEQFNLQSSANSFREALNGDRNPKWIEVWSYIYLGKIFDILGQRQRALAEYSKAVNTKDDTNGAQAEANKWLAAPFIRERPGADTKKD